VAGTVTTPIKKYPSRFYSGKKAFADSVASSYATQAGGTASALSAKTSSSLSMAAADVSTPTSATATVEESDVWKTDGTTVYFFNQLRGLQVVDLSDPASPSLVASYRLPAKGSDLYVVPGTGRVRYAVLLTQESSWPASTGVKIVKVDGGKATLTGSTTVPGWMADSRMVGNRLYLVTQQWSWSSGSNQDSTTLSELAVNSADGTMAVGNSTVIPGSWPVISAGNDWLAVSESDWSDWQTSKLTLFSLGETGATRLMADPLKLSGRIYDKYNVQYASGVLSTVSQRWDLGTNSDNGWWWNGVQVTTLDNYTASGSKLASLEIQRGEQLHAARFAGDKAYVVTARQTDPLFVIDLSDATNPVIAGQVQVPGWSTHIEPVGQDKLFTIGFDGNWKVAASLFNVSDPANPSLLSRVSLAPDAGSWGYSSATYDDKALKVLPDAGLVMVPYTSWNSTNGTSDSYVQLLKLDAAEGTLALGGTITHRLDPLRADLIGSALASISQRELVTADVSSPDKPVVLADITLAWTVNRIVASGDSMIQITDGGSWTGEPAMARVSTVADPDAGLREISLGDGVVKDAVLKDGRLYVLRQNPPDTVWNGWWARPLLYGGGSSVQSGGTTPSLFLDIYDASKPPALSLKGSVAAQLPGNDTAWDVGSLVFASPDTLAVVAQPQSRNFCWWWPPVYYGGPIVAMADAVPYVGSVKPAARAGKVAEPAAVVAVDPPLTTNLACRVYPGYADFSPSTNPASAMIFQVSNPSAPVAQPPLALTDAGNTPVKYSTAGSGMLVYGYGEKETPWNQSSGESLTTSRHHLRFVDLTDVANPVLSPVFDLPGRLQEVSDLSTDGFLAWTTTRSGGFQLQVSACDGITLSQVASQSLAQNGAVVARGRDAFAVQGNSVCRYSLADSGILAAAGSIAMDWSPSSLRALPSNGTPQSTLLLGSDWSHLLTSIWKSSGGDSLEWPTDRPVDVTKAVTLPDGSVLSPADTYGVDSFQH
jgi:uncharacterized secreted protein with C-terminal beta-propeller domain